MTDKTASEKHALRAKAAEKLEQAKTTVREGTAQARERVATAYASTRKTAETARDRAVAGAEQNPLAIVVGGLAIGAVAAALLPRTARETKVLGPVGKRIRNAASDAAKAAKQAGADTLDSLGVNGDAARAEANRLVQSALSAVTQAGEAAVKTAREAAKKKS
jgi:hypothetical protein